MCEHEEPMNVWLGMVCSGMIRYDKAVVWYGMVWYSGIKGANGLILTGGARIA